MPEDSVFLPLLTANEAKVSAFYPKHEYKIVLPTTIEGFAPSVSKMAEGKGINPLTSETVIVTGIFRSATKNVSFTDYWILNKNGDILLIHSEEQPIRKLDVETAKAKPYISVGQAA